MDTKQHQDDFPEVQAAIYGVALSLDSFLMNGIPYGVIHQAFFNGFLQKTATTLLRDLTTLQTQVEHIPAHSQPKVTEVLGTLRTKCQQIIDLVSELRSFRTLPLQQLRSTVSRIPLLRGECVRLIQELEDCFQTPKPFYQSRPADSTASVNDFLSNLEQLLTEEWLASDENRRLSSLENKA